MAAWIVTAWLANRFFYPSWNRSLHQAEVRHRSRAARTFGPPSVTGLRAWLRRRLPLSRATRALIVKDGLTFIREPMQWGQCALIFGLLLLYTSNLRNLGYPRQEAWTAIISHLNLTVCCLAMSTLTTRFVFPQFSLEGQRLWLLGLAPFPLTHVIRQKLWLNLAASAPLTVMLVAVSCVSLQLPFHRAVFFVSAMVLMTIGLNTLALALGTLLPNLRETNSAKIVSSFGGTLCLVTSFFYIAMAMAILIAPTVLQSKAQGQMPLEKMYTLQASSLGALFILTVVMGGIPYFFALRRTKTLANLGEL
jgi:ABC-2 type transport system permease protein